nr:HXXEE domain-containing protein [Anaerotignum neopropionicum]
MMDKYIWLFPVVFIFHDLEEMLGLSAWIFQNKSMLNQKFPKFSKVFEHYSTGHALCGIRGIHIMYFNLYCFHHLPPV